MKRFLKIVCSNIIMILLCFSCLAGCKNEANPARQEENQTTTFTSENKKIDNEHSTISISSKKNKNNSYLIKVTKNSEVVTEPSKSTTIHITNKKSVSKTKATKLNNKTKKSKIVRRKAKVTKKKAKLKKNNPKNKKTKKKSTKNKKKSKKNKSKANKTKKTYTKDELYILSHLIYGEASGCSRDFKIAVGSVVLNRVKSSKFPNAIKDVAFQSGQYACTWDGGYNKTPDKQTIEVAKYLLENGSQIPDYVIFQAEFFQGDSVWKRIGNTYFCYYKSDKK